MPQHARCDIITPHGKESETELFRSGGRFAGPFVYVGGGGGTAKHGPETGTCTDPFAHVTSDGFPVARTKSVATRQIGDPPANAAVHIVATIQAAVFFILDLLAFPQKSYHNLQASASLYALDGQFAAAP